MSAFTLFTAGLACLAPFVAAYTQPVGDTPSGNPISLPGLGSIVPVGEAYTIQWEPTTNGTVTLVLLSGAATDLSVVGPIAESIENNGSYTWVPASNLTPGSTSTTGYGIQLIVDATGQYQYTTQFGISGGSNSSSGSSSSWPTATGYWGSDSTSSVSSASDAWSTGSASTASWSNATSTDSYTSIITAAPIASGSLATSIVSASSISAAATSASSTTHTSTSTTSSSTATSTGGAATLKSGAVGLVIVAGAAFFAL